MVKLTDVNYNWFLGLELLSNAIEKAGYTGRIKIGMDVAASEFFKKGQYDLDFKNPKSDKSKWVGAKLIKVNIVIIVLCGDRMLNRWVE